jgi:hypothetical protein
MMGLQLRDIRRGPNDDKYAWTPFAPSDQFTPDWWDRVPYMDDNPHYVGAWIDDAVVARVELDHDFRGSAPTSGHLSSEIAHWRSSSSRWPSPTGVKASAPKPSAFWSLTIQIGGSWQ